MKEKLARWFIEKYLPDMHLHNNPKSRKPEHPTEGDFISREAYMNWRHKAKGPIISTAPDPRDYETPEEFEHEREKWVMKMEAQREGDR
jgi:hypothetical protein